MFQEVEKSPPYKKVLIVGKWKFLPQKLNKTFLKICSPKKHIVEIALFKKLTSYLLSHSSLESSNSSEEEKPQTLT